MQRAYFSHPYGLRDRYYSGREFRTISEAQEKCTYTVQQLMWVSHLVWKIIFWINTAELTTKILRIISPEQVTFWPHELRWNSYIFGTGYIPEKENVFTYPDRIFQNGEREKPKIKKISRSPYRISRNFLNSTCIYVSRISRLDGRSMMNEDLYRWIKSRDPNSIVIVDTAQTIWALIEDVSKYCDIALGISSKFIGSNPHLAFGWISQWVLDRFTQLQNFVSVHKKDYITDYSQLYHHGTIITKKHWNGELENHINFCSNRIKSIIEQSGYPTITPPLQPPHFITFSIWWSYRKTEIFRKYMAQRWILLSSTGGNWSFDESDIQPMIRMGINYETTEEEVNAFKATLKKI